MYYGLLLYIHVNIANNIRCIPSYGQPSFHQSRRPYSLSARNKFAHHRIGFSFIAHASSGKHSNNPLSIVRSWRENQQLIGMASSSLVNIFTNQVTLNTMIIFKSNVRAHPPKLEYVPQFQLLSIGIGVTIPRIFNVKVPKNLVPFNIPMNSLRLIITA